MLYAQVNEAFRLLSHEDMRWRSDNRAWGYKHTQWPRQFLQADFRNSWTTAAQLHFSLSVYLLDDA